MLKILSSMIILIFASLGHAKYNTTKQGWKIVKVTDKSAVKVMGSIIKSVKLGEVLTEGDYIETHQGKLVLRLNNSEIMVGSDTNFEIRKDEKDSRQPVFKVVLGKVRANIKKPEANKYIYKLPSMVAGIRGTQFFLSHSPENKEILCVLEGEVEVENTKAGEKIRLKKGKGLVIEAADKGKVIDTTQEQIKKWIQSTTI